MPLSDIGFESFLGQLPDTVEQFKFSEPPGAKKRLEAGFSAETLIDDKRRKFLFNKYVKGLVNPWQAHRNVFSEHAMNDIQDPAERVWLTQQVQEISKAQEHFRRQRDAKSGYWQRFAERSTELMAAPLEGMTEMKESFVGPNRLFGKKYSFEDIQFRKGLESAKLSENPFIPKDAGTLRRGMFGAGKMGPDVATGGVTFVAGGVPALMAYSAMRVIPEAVEYAQESGLSGPAAGAAGLTIGAGVGAIEVIGTRDPTGILKKATSPLAQAGRKVVTEWIQKTFPKIAEKGGAALAKRLKTKVALEGLSEYLYRGALEVGEEGGQGAWEESVNVASSLLNENVSPREKWSIPKAFIRDIKESALPIAIIGTAGPIIRATVSETDFEKVLRKHHAKGTVPSRREWRLGGMKKASMEEKKALLPEIINEFNINEQVLAGREDTPISQKQHDRWDLPSEAGKTPTEWREFIGQKEQVGRESEAQEAAEIQEQAPGPQETAIVPQKVAQEPVGPEVAQEPGVTPEAPTTTEKLPFDMFKVKGVIVTQNPSSGELQDMAREARKKSGDAVLPLRNTLDKNGNKWYWDGSEADHATMEQGIANRTKKVVHQFPFIMQDLIKDADSPAVRQAVSPETVQEAPAAVQPEVDLNKKADINNAAGEAWLQEEGYGEIPERDHGPKATELIGDVINSERADTDGAGALELANKIIIERRLTDDRDHVKLAVGFGKIKGKLEELRAQKKAVLKAEDKINYDLIVESEKDLLENMNIILQASKYSGTVVARALNIRRSLRNIESYDEKDVINRVQDARKGEKATKEQLGEINELTSGLRESTNQEKQIEFQEQEIQEKKLKKTAEEVVRRIRSSGGKTMAEKAIAERKILLERVKVIQETGGKEGGFLFEERGSYSPEVLFLMGQIGITYVKQGVGNIADVVTRVRDHFPEASDTDVWRALNTRNPSHKKREKTIAEKRVRDVKTIARLLTETDDIQNGIPPKIRSKRQPLLQIKNLSKKIQKLRNEYYKSELDVTKKEKAIDKLTHSLSLLSRVNSSLKKDSIKIPDDLEGIKNLTREINSELKVREEIADFKEQKRTGNYHPLPVREKKPISDRLKKAQIESSRLRAEIRRLIENAEILSTWGKAKKISQVVTSEIRAITATADISFTFRQNFWTIFGSNIWSHPIDTMKNIGKSLQAIFSQNTAEEITNGILHSQNAPLYLLHGLEIMDPGSVKDQKTAEVFRGRIENFKIPGTNIQWPLGMIMSASNRQSVAVSNLIRSSAFDYFLENRPNSTKDELSAMADYINKSTGLGDLAFLKGLAPYFRETMFSPRFAVSRFQTPWTAIKYRHLPNVRNKIALDSVRVASTAGLIFMLAKMAGADVELWDTDSPDWLKIRVGNTRYDILAGILQPIRYVANIGKHGAKEALRIEEKNIVWNNLLFNFWWYKMAPAYSAAGTILMGHNVVGEEMSRTETLARLLVPLIGEAIYDTWQREPEQAIPVGAATFVGIGASTYTDSFTAAQRRYNMLLRNERYAEATAYKTEYDKRRKKGGKKLHREKKK